MDGITTAPGAVSAAPVTSLKKVAIVGTAPFTRANAPKPGGEWEVWACGTLTADAPECDRFFEIHNPSFFKDAEPIGYWDWLHKVECPVYTFHPIPTLQRNVLFPRERVEAAFGPHFLTSSIAWMQALAVYEERPAIGLWGVEMASDAEYAEQKAACIHWIEMARHRGMDVVIPPESELLHTGKSYPDNFEDPSYRRVVHRKNIFSEQLAQVKKQIDMLRLAEARLEGQLEEIRAMERTLVTNV